jgi:hypothetical protein
MEGQIKEEAETTAAKGHKLMHGCSGCNRSRRPVLKEQRSVYDLVIPSV